MNTNDYTNDNLNPLAVLVASIIIVAVLVVGLYIAFQPMAQYIAG